MCPFTVSLSDHVGNIVDGAEAVWTWRAIRLGESDEKGSFADDESAAHDEKAAEENVFNPQEGASFKLLTSGMYELRVCCGPDLLPSAAGKPGTPTILHIMPSGLSVEHSTVCGSGLYSRYPDMPEPDEEREVVLVARDQFGNRLGTSPKELVSSFFVTLQPMDAPGAEAPSGASASPSPTPGDSPVAGKTVTLVASPGGAGGGGGVMPEIMVIDDKSGVLRAVYPVLEIGSYNVTVSLGTDVLISRKIVSGKAKDRPKNLYHWSEEETIFAQEFSVAMQRAELVKQELERQAEAYRTERFQKQFRKKGQPIPDKPKSMAASEIFALVDEDDSGAISEAELRGHMRLRGYTEEEILNAVKTLDVDGDGQISAEEFAALEKDGGEGDPSLEDLLMPYQAPDSVFDSLKHPLEGGDEPCVIEDPAKRAISLKQLKELYLSQVVRRCAAEVGLVGDRIRIAACGRILSSSLRG